MREAKHYRGNEITLDVIDKLKEIAFKRCGEDICSYDSLDSCLYYDTNVHEENVILGIDWYITYADKEDEIEILEWVSLENIPKKFEQSIEMLNELKRILLLSKGRKVKAYMNHQTSYAFYQKLLENGYVYEICDSLQIEDRGIDQCIYHDIDFSVSDKFIQRYEKK